MDAPVLDKSGFEYNRTYYQKFTFCLLSALGLIPFIALTVLASLRENEHYWLDMLVTYGAIIVTFVSGVQWGLMLRHYHSVASTFCTLVSAVSFALVAWTLIFNDNFEYLKLSILIAGFLGLWMVDYLLYKNATTEKWYFQMRTVITVSVILILLYSVV